MPETPLESYLGGDPSSLANGLCGKRLAGTGPLVLWHLLSLDAPTVAVLWTVFTATVTHTVLPLATPAAMALAVWTLYAADRLLDTRHLRASDGADFLCDLERRHFFHHRHRLAFTTGIAVATLALVILLPMLPTSAIRLYLAEGAAMAGYFLLIHTSPQTLPRSTRSHRSFVRRIPKEVLVGPFFAAAVFVPTVSRNPALRSSLIPCVLLFAALCSLNCLYIYRWEHLPDSQAPWATVISIRHLGTITALLFASSVLCSLLLHLHPQAISTLQLYPLACAGSALILFVLHRLSARLSPITLRASADAALLTPLIILPFLSWHRL